MRPRNCFVGMLGMAGGVLTARAAGSEPAVTFTRDVAPILYRNCATCHRPGDIGPFPLISYGDAKRRAAQIVSVTRSRLMPPWHADSHGEFANERKLTSDQIDTLRRWSDAGAPEGARADLPPAPKPATSEWKLGKPDLVLQADRNYVVGPDGPEIYAYFVYPTGLTDDRYLSGIEFQIGNTRVVHHIIAMVDSTGKARSLAAQRGNGYTGETFGGFIPATGLGGWAPGNLPRRFPDGIGILIPKGGDVVLQVHYHRDGKVERDRTRIGLYFARKPVDKRLRVAPIFATLRIPAGDPNYVLKARVFPVKDDMSIVQIMPHMHLLARSATVYADEPDQRRHVLIDVPNWDFNWQTMYVYREPMHLPAGSWFGMTARYDNSSTNPRNPFNPPQEIYWGEATTDEMCTAFIWYTYDREHLLNGVKVTDMMDDLTTMRPFLMSIYKGMGKHVTDKPSLATPRPQGTSDLGSSK